MGSGSKDKESNPVPNLLIESNASGHSGICGGIYAPADPYFYAHASHQDDGCMSKTNSLKSLFYYIIILSYYYQKSPGILIENHNFKIHSSLIFKPFLMILGGFE